MSHESVLLVKLLEAGKQYFTRIRVRNTLTHIQPNQEPLPIISILLYGCGREKRHVEKPRVEL